MLYLIMISEYTEGSEGTPFVTYRGDSEASNQPFVSRVFATQAADELLKGRHKQEQEAAKTENLWMNTRDLEYGYSDLFGVHTVRFRVVKLS